MPDPSVPDPFVPDLSVPDPSGSPKPQSADVSRDGEGMAMQITPAQPQDWGQIEGSSTGIPVLKPKAQNAQAGLGSLVLTVVELVRQLMEAQVVRRMEAGRLTEAEIERAGQSLQTMRDQILTICDLLEIDPNDLNLDLGELGRLLPKEGSYYPDQPSQDGSLLELLDRLITTGIVVDGEIDLGLAQLDLIHARLKLVLVSDAKLI